MSCKLCVHCQYLRAMRSAPIQGPVPPPKPSLAPELAHVDGDCDDIGLLKLSPARVSLLRSAGHRTVGDVANATEADLLRIRGFGRNSLKRTKEALNTWRRRLPSG